MPHAARTAARPTIRAASRCVTATVAAGALLAAAASPVAAQGVADRAASRPLDLSIAVRGGTLGAGAEVGKLVASRLGVRLGAYVFSYSAEQEFEDVSYDAQLKLRNVTALVDLFPGRRGRFHLTGGVVAGTTEIAGTGLPEGGTYVINGRAYSAAEVGTLGGEVRFPSARPYAGLGWGTPAKNAGAWGFSTDFGVVFGAPTATLTATGAGSNPELQADLETERENAQADLDEYARFYPVINFGITYRF